MGTSYYFLNKHCISNGPNFNGRLCLFEILCCLYKMLKWSKFLTEKYIFKRFCGIIRKLEAIIYHFCVDIKWAKCT